MRVFFGKFPILDLNDCWRLRAENTHVCSLDLSLQGSEVEMRVYC